MGPGCEVDERTGAKCGDRRVEFGSPADRRRGGAGPGCVEPVALLLERELADEVLLFVYPVLLGRGKRFFSDIALPRSLPLAGTKAASSGVVISTYRPGGPLRTSKDAAAQA